MGQIIKEAKISWVPLASSDALFMENAFAIGKGRKAKTL